MVSKVVFVKVAVQDDDSEIDGISLWAGNWEITSISQFIDRQRFDGLLVSSVKAYKLTADGQSIHFWAGELKAGGYAIYV